MSAAPSKAESPSSPRKSFWMSKFKSSKNQEGTVLHAVPQNSAGRSMSALDIARAISPNEEILQAIRKSSTINTSPPASPLDNREVISASKQHGVFDSRIGVWRDGVVLWDVGKSPKKLETPLEPSEKTTSFSSATDKARRPRLSVRIPGSKLRQILGEEAPVPGDKPRQSPRDEALVHGNKLRQILGAEAPIPACKPIRAAPAMVATRYSTSPQPSSPNEMAIHPALRTTSPLIGNRRSEVRSLSSGDNSRSSVSSNTIFQDDTFDNGSCYSRSSSMTSVEAESPDDLVQDSHWNYLDVPKRSVSAAFSITSPVQAGIFDEVSADGHTPRAGSTFQHLQIPALDHRAPSPTFSEAKSRKRQWVQPVGVAHGKPAPASIDVPVRRQSVPTRQENRLSSHEEDIRRVSSVRCSLSHDVESMWLSWSVSSAKKSSASAFEQEVICLQTMAASLSFEDLNSLSMVSKTARRFYEENKLHLLKSVLFNVSPPAWELRELSPFPFGHFMPAEFLEDTGITPSTYMSCISHDRAIVQELKDVIATKCQSFLRPETISSLMTEGCTRSEDAIYRIWSFCKIFGCDRGRDNDLKGQTDWLKGGILAHQKGCAATLSFSPEFEMDGILLNAPDHFAAGNGSGLSAEQLYDMSEIWECLYALMQPYEGETSKAQSTGVFRHTGGSFMDPMVQASVVEEWIAYILSLGPSVVLELARFQDASDAGFDFAQLNDWTDWAPLQSGMTRRRFFREPVAQLYEERLLATTAGTQTKDVTKTLLRKRQTAEMNLAYRQMSMSNKKNKVVPCTLYRRDNALAPEVHRKSSSSSPTTPSSPRPFSPDTAHGGRVQPNSWSPRKVSPIIEDRVDTFNRLSMLSFEGMAEDTSGLAIGRIMDIGFSNAQAKEALRITDMGNGLRVDRAVDWLLRQDRF
ncbi:unnamed protein product [Aureobasidium pullulans]|nr:unnamed protein product [Aureobasidium pullulans]